jgi:hypothetical protein
MHGSVSKEYLIKTDPYLFVISAQEAVYKRIAYTRDFNEAIRQIVETRGRLKEICLTLEKGNVLICAEDREKWFYSTYRPNIILAGLYP